MGTLNKVLLVFLLFGCSTTPPASQTLTESTKETIKALEESLPKECKTESVKLQFAALEAKVDSTLATCETEKALLEEKKRHSDTLVGFWFVWCVVLLGVLLRKVFRS